MYTIAVFTGARSEYGVLKPLIKRLKTEKSFILKLIVSGSHLSPEFGMTVKDIESDGYVADEKIEILMSSDSEVGISKSMGLAMISFSEAYQRIKPDILVVVGDRYEAFAAIAVAAVANIPVAHISGGDVTEGAYDDAFRHSMTKMSYLHFPGNEESAKRIVQLGEAPDRVFNVGEPGLENIKNMNFYSVNELEKMLNIELGEKYFTVIFHPITLEKGNAESQYKEVLNAISKFKDYRIVFIKGNADSEGRVINKMLEEYVTLNENCYAFDSLKIQEYLSLIKNSKCVIGNSSSGIIEAPSFKIPTINIGDRQKGRLRAKSVIECTPDAGKIIECINKAVSKEFQFEIADTENPYGDGNTSIKILEILKEFLEKNKINLKKKFYDIRGE